ncbi:MAG TPA: tryptophan halogenase family protein [Povalibacter sp.]|nr:tryptophan halogenase family protein [Povalibacter sp.]
MTDQRIDRVVIVGSGVPAWLAALTLHRTLGEKRSVRVIETPMLPEQIGWECGDFSLPPLRSLHRLLGIDEREFMRATQATFRLATEFRGWTAAQPAYVQPLGELGAALEGIAFHHHWLRLRDSGGVGEDIGAFSLNAVAARQGRFVHPSPDPRSILSTLDYAYHFDAQAHARYVRETLARKGVQVVTGKIAHVALREPDGFIQELTLDSGERIGGDLFIDCGGADSPLADALHVGYEDWSHWLPCDRVVALPGARELGAAPLTSVTAQNAGWRWQAPLQHRLASGYVFCSDFISDDAAVAELRAAVKADERIETRVTCFTSGHRTKFWSANCIALGLAAGCMEPLHATGLHLVHTALARLATLFPHGQDMSWVCAEYNRLTTGEYERIRDLLILHYHAAAPAVRTPFWESAVSRGIPESLQHKLRVFASRGRVVLLDEETFTESHWVSVLLGQQVRPEHLDALALTLPVEPVREQLRRMKVAIDQAAQAMPLHDTIIRHHCAAAQPG